MGKEKKKSAAKRIRWAKNYASEAPRFAGRLVVTLIAVIILGMLFSALQGIETIWLRIVLSASMVAVMLGLFFVEGLNKGADDAANSRFYMQASKNGRRLEAHDDVICFHPLKAALACVIVFILPLALAIYLCAVAKPYTYSLQDLPTWLTGSYGSRGDVMGPLAAYAQRASAIGVTGWIRVFVRMTVMCFINLFVRPLEMSALIDRLSPLMVASYPMAYVLGYLMGPSTRRKIEKQNRRAKKVAVRKAQKSTLAKELVGEQNAVHYGQRRDSDKPKKKELV